MTRTGYLLGIWHNLVKHDPLKVRNTFREAVQLIPLHDGPSRASTAILYPFSLIQQTSRENIQSGKYTCDLIFQPSTPCLLHLK